MRFAFMFVCLKTLCTCVNKPRHIYNGITGHRHVMFALTCNVVQHFAQHIAQGGTTGPAMCTYMHVSVLHAVAALFAISYLDQTVNVIDLGKLHPETIALHMEVNYSWAMMAD